MKVIFRPKTTSVTDIIATAHGQRIWEEMRGTIIEALEQTSGLKFKEKKIYARSGVFSGTHSGWPGEEAMHVPLNLPYDDAKPSDLHYRSDLEFLSSVIHELSHRLLIEHGIRVPTRPKRDFEAHQHIYLFMLDAEALAYGHDMAERMHAIELSYISEGSYMPRTIHWVQKLSKAKRQEYLTYLLRHKKLPRSIVINYEPPVPKKSKIPDQAVK